MFSEKVYKILKAVAQYILPAAGTLLFALSGVWGFPCEKIVGTITAVDTFIGVLLGIDTALYNAPVIEDKGDD